MELYHGSYTVVSQPRVISGRYTKDFGNGFYCTELKQQAERWAGKYETPAISVYDYHPIEELKKLNFDGMSDPWLDFVAACRTGMAHDYDIVSGPMADNQIYNYVSDFISGILTREQFWALAKFKYPTQQTAFCTDESLRCITFKNSYTL